VDFMGSIVNFPGPGQMATSNNVGMMFEFWWVRYWCTCGERADYQYDCYQYDLHTDTFCVYNGNAFCCSEGGNLNKLLHEQKVKFPASKKLSMMNGVIFLCVCICYTYFRWAQMLEWLFQFIFHVVFWFPATFKESGRDIHTQM
jgi:hypothetical protein